eukprot:CAMPEP_0201573178 /NCGR_PEP_ID=MMETSP0190_2-20130828/16888_1 /ASSEMBLY_ACC=CAM_ASM_000263 /TAXON_ID=37353 /ORGANISM="Rosalina sp." /LENGTH=59 /DNA_ID=CAMNT_0047999829 /DNA_START=16 /DNA_END=191 /DNA_ORIENTATION=-
MARLIAFCIIPPIIVSIILMWIFYAGVFDTEKNETAFWLIAVIPFSWSMVICIYMACKG